MSSVTLWYEFLKNYDEPFYTFLSLQSELRSLVSIGDSAAGGGARGGGASSGGGSSAADDLPRPPSTGSSRTGERSRRSIRARITGPSSGSGGGAGGGARGSGGGGGKKRKEGPTGPLLCDSAPDWWGGEKVGVAYSVCSL